MIEVTWIEHPSQYSFATHWEGRINDKRRFLIPFTGICSGARKGNSPPRAPLPNLIWYDEAGSLVDGKHVAPNRQAAKDEANRMAAEDDWT